MSMHEGFVPARGLLGNVVPAAIVAIVAVFFPNPIKPVGKFAAKLLGPGIIGGPSAGYRTSI